jgi:GST-like protein
MIELYKWSTPNGRKVSIALEELEIPYRVNPIDITKGDQFNGEFLRLSPNNKIPAIVDTEHGVSLMESGTILTYLADKAGCLVPSKGEKRYRVLEWLSWQAAGMGPMFGQLHTFRRFNRGKAPFAEERFAAEVRRLYQVLNRRLNDREYIVDEYSIADVAAWPWVSRYEWQEVDLREYPNVLRWYLAIARRPAVQRGYKVPRDVEPIPVPN